MTRLLTAVAVSSLLLSGAVAEAAKKKPRAKVYSATFTAASGSAYAAVTGKAQMVDNKKRDTAKIQLKGLLGPGAVYSWMIYKVNGDKPACAAGSAGEGVEAFRYKSLRVNAAGNASATAKSKSLVTFTTTRYAVAVRDANDVVVACAELKRKKKARG